MKSFDTKDSKVPNGKFESSHRKHSELEESPNDFSEVSIGKFESSQSKDPESECSPNGVCKVSNRKFESSHRKDSDDSKLCDPNFESSDMKDSKIDGRSRSRTTKQINSYKKNFSKGHSIHWRLQELDTRLRHLQSLVLSMR